VTGADCNGCKETREEVDQGQDPQGEEAKVIRFVLRRATSAERLNRPRGSASRRQAGTPDLPVPTAIRPSIVLGLFAFADDAGCDMIRDRSVPAIRSYLRQRGRTCSAVV
jgi:hypothetical protein